MSSGIDELVDTSGSKPSIKLGDLAESLTGTVLWWLFVPIAGAIELFFDGITTSVDAFAGWLFSRELVTKVTPDGYVGVVESEQGFLAAAWDLPESYIAGAAAGLENSLAPFGIFGYLIAVVLVWIAIAAAMWSVGVIIRSATGGGTP